MREGWELKKLGDVCTIIGGGTPSKSNIKFYNGNILWATVRDMKSDVIVDTEHKITPDAIKSSSSNIIPKDNVVIATRVGLGKVCLLKYDTAINQDLKGIIPVDKTLSVNFLYRWFQSIEMRIVAEGTGATVQGVKLPFIKSLSIPIPPVEKQQQIVSILDQAFAAIDKAKANIERNLQNAKELYESELIAITSQENKNWVEKKLGEVCLLYQGIAINSKTKHALVEHSELPLLRIKDLKNNTFEQFVDPNNFPKNALVDVDDLIYTRTGSLGLVFRGFKGVLHNNSFKVVPNNELCKDYLYIWLQSPLFLKKIMSIAGKAAQPDITHKLFKEQVINFPNTIDEQVTIVRQLDELSAKTKKLENLYQKKLSNLENLKKSILQKAFSGELKNKEIEAVTT